MLSCTHLSNNASWLQCDIMFAEVMQDNRDFATGLEEDVYQRSFRDHTARKAIVFTGFKHKSFVLTVLPQSDVAHDTEPLLWGNGDCG